MPVFEWACSAIIRGKYGTPSEGFNIVCTTYRLTEHYHYWTKNNPMNVELVPELDMTGALATCLVEGARARERVA